MANDQDFVSATRCRQELPPLEFFCITIGYYIGPIHVCLPILAVGYADEKQKGNAENIE